MFARLVWLLTENEHSELGSMNEKLVPTVTEPAQSWGPRSYIAEEVARQGHPGDKLRERWMWLAWDYAQSRCSSLPTIADIETMGRLIEPDRNAGGFRQCGVRVGNRICPPAGEVRERLHRLWLLEGLTPIEFYKEFEMIHPFRDGNGRTGKVLLNWLNCTLAAPIFPPADLFGHPIRNP